MGLPARDTERFALLNGRWWGATSRLGSIWWLLICRAIPCCCCKAHMGILILHHDAMDEPVHGSVPGEDNEEGAFYRDEKQWEALIATALLPSLHGNSTVSPVLLAWQHRCMIQFPVCFSFVVHITSDILVFECVVKIVGEWSQQLKQFEHQQYVIDRLYRSRVLLVKLYVMLPRLSFCYQPVFIGRPL